MEYEPHLFTKRPTAAKRVEFWVFWLFRLATYTVIACATYIFGDIFWNGAQTVFIAQPPFINIPFLVEAPQTLHVFEEKEVVAELDQTSAKMVATRAQVRALGAYDKANRERLRAELKVLQARFEELDMQRKETRLMYGDKDYRKLENPPDRSRYVYNTYSYSGGGIGPQIVGTVLLVGGSVAIALFLGVACAIYLSEYSRPGKWLQSIRLAILNLSGVPSIVFGLFGFGIFVLYFDWGKSLLAGWFTLAFMALPLIIAASEESLRAIPKGFREGSLALGATKWTSIRTNVLPYALPGILTSSIMGIARVAGETAPIMFTAAYAMRDELPWEGLKHWYDFFFQGVMAMPYHIYVVSAKIPQNEYTRSMQYGAAFVFMFIVGSLALASILLRVRMRNKYKW